MGAGGKEAGCWACHVHALKVLFVACRERDVGGIGQLPASASAAGPGSQDQEMAEAAPAASGHPPSPLQIL